MYSEVSVCTCDHFFSKHSTELQIRTLIYMQKHFYKYIDAAISYAVSNSIDEIIGRARERDIKNLIRCSCFSSFQEFRFLHSCRQMCHTLVVRKELAQWFLRFLSPPAQWMQTISLLIGEGLINTLEKLAARGHLCVVCFAKKEKKKHIIYAYTRLLLVSIFTFLYLLKRT